MGTYDQLMIKNIFTCIDTSTSDKESVAQAENKWTQIDVPERMEGWQLRENYHDCCHHCYELIQFQWPIRRKFLVHDLQQPKREGIQDR